MVKVRLLPREPWPCSSTVEPHPVKVARAGSIPVAVAKCQVVPCGETEIMADYESVGAGSIPAGVLKYLKPGWRNGSASLLQSESVGSTPALGTVMVV